MIIKPGVEPPSTLNLSELVLASSKKKVDVLFMDDAGTPVDISEVIFGDGSADGELDVRVTNLDGTVIFEEAYWPRGNPPGTRISKGSTGRYSFTLTATETAETGTIIAAWHIRQNRDAEDFYRIQVIEIASARVLAVLPRLRLMLDKSVKPVLPEQLCLLGYTDGMLVTFLQLGLEKINSAQPYVTWSNLGQFPLSQFSEILVKSALYQGVMAQVGFAIDTDVPSYSDSGHSFVIDHGSKLMNYMGVLSTQLDKEIPNFKLHFVKSGIIAAELRFGLRYYTMLTSAPSGSLFFPGYTNIT
jgi:hypothetical protein